MQTITFELWDKTQFKCNLLIWNRIEYYNFIFAVFHLLPLQFLINNPVFYYNNYLLSFYRTTYPIKMNYFILRSILEKYILEIERLNCLTSNFLSFDFDLERSFYCTIRNLYSTSYLSAIDIFPPYRSFLKIFDFEASRFWPWPSTFRGHLR